MSQFRKPKRPPGRRRVPLRGKTEALSEPKSGDRWKLKTAEIEVLANILDSTGRKIEYFLDGVYRVRSLEAFRSLVIDEEFISGGRNRT